MSPARDDNLDLEVMAQPLHIRRAVLLWVTVTVALWAAIPVTMYLSHWTWFGWMPRVDMRPLPPPGTAPPPNPQPGAHLGPSPIILNMVTILVMSSVVMAVVLWLLSMRKAEDAAR
jgi:hypothetical protein